MLLVEQCNGRAQVEPLRNAVADAAGAVESVAIAYQNAQLPLWSRSRNLHRDLAHNAIAAIGPEHGFNDDFVSRASFGYIGASSLKPGGAAVADEIHIEINT